MMKKLKLTTLFLLMASTTFAISNDAEIDFLYGYLQGTYILIGKAPDSNVTYHGIIELIKMENKLQVLRIISGKTVIGEGNIEYVTADSIKVLRIRFTEDKKNYQATYLIGSDLDNYGRLTGYLYEEDVKPRIPGFEALFSDHILK